MTIKILIGLGAIAALFLWLTIAYAREHVRRHGAHKIVGRTLTGRRTDGSRHTNASFWRKSDGKTIGHAVGRVSKRHHRAGIANLARTLGWIVAIALTGYGLMHDITLTFIGASLAFTVWLAIQLYKLTLRLRQWYMHRTYITPLAEALAPKLELTGPELEQSIVMEPDYQDKKTGVLGRIYLPPRFHADGSGQDTINSLISSRLPVGADYQWKLKGKKPHILMTAAPSLPTMVRFMDYVREIEALEPRQYIPGVTRSGNTYKATFGGEEVHHGMAYNTGRGKSTALKLIISTIFHNEQEATGTVIDPKDISLDCLVGVPGLTFYNDSDDVPAMWDGITNVYELMRQRKKELKEDPTREFPTHLLILEEANSFAVISKAVWNKIKPRGAPANPPVWIDAIAPIFWQGRQFCIFVVLVAQNINDRFLGGLSLRSSLGLISMSGYKMNQWDTYVGTTPRLKPQRGRGRAIYIEGESETWVQNFYGTDAEFREFAMHGRRHLVEPTTEEVASVNGYHSGAPTGYRSEAPTGSSSGPVPTLTGTIVPNPRVPT